MIKERAMEFIHFIYKYRNAGGSAILPALLIMAIISIIGVYAISIATTELNIATNVKTGKSALYNAEAGVQYTLARIYRDLNDGMTIDEIEARIPYDTPLAFASDNPGTFEVQATHTPWSGTDGNGFTSTGTGPRGASFTVEVTFRNEEVPLEAFNVGVFSNRSLRIAGGGATLGFDGSLHSNEEIWQSGAGTGYITGAASSVGTVNVGPEPEEGSHEFGDEIETPPFELEDLWAWEDSADIAYDSDNPPAEPYELDREALGIGDDTHVIVYVDGDVTVDNSAFRNATLVANGTITVSEGDNDLPEPENDTPDNGTTDTAFIAYNDIELDGREFDGLFWARQNVDWRGLGSNAHLRGSIVAGGEVDTRGGFTFTQAGIDDRINIPRKMQVMLTSWADTGLL